MFKRSHRTAACAIAMAAFMSPAASVFAADLDVPPPPPPEIRPTVQDWTGGYVGGVAGVSCIDGYYVPTPGSDPTFAGCGFIGGVVAGWNYQYSNFVIGAEGDWSWGSHVAHNPAPENTDYSINWMSTIRGRLGWLSTDKTLIYATAGVAWINGDFDGLVGAVSQPASDTKTHTGFVVGGGIEHAFTQSLHGRVEYLYANMNNKTYDHTVAACPAASCTSDLHLDDVHVVRAGLTWNFGNFGGLSW